MPELLDSDMIVLVTPLYYYDMSAQLKTVIDRMHGRLRSFDGKKSILMATALEQCRLDFSTRLLTIMIRW